MVLDSLVEPKAVCDCPGCAAGLEPFTVEHFRLWAAGLVLDNGRPWVVEPYEEAFIADLFAGIPVCWLVIPEENGKTTLVSGLALYYLEHFPVAAIPVAASSKEQAETIYLQAEGFVMRSPRLSEPMPDLVLQAKGLKQRNNWQRRDVPRFTCQEGFRRIRFYRGGRMQIRASDERTSDGIIPAGILIIDELHRQSLKLYRTWLGKLDKRNAQLIVISTAGEPGGEFEEEREMLRQSADTIERTGCFTRAVSEERVLHDWALPEEGDPEDFELVAQANPASWITPATLERKFNRLGKSGRTLAHWRRLTCNLPTRSDSAAITELEWHQAIAKENEIPEGEPVWVGLDVAWKWDTTAVVPLWWKTPKFRLLGTPRILTPPRDGSMLDPYLVEHAIAEIHQRNPITAVVMDISDAADIAAWIQTELRVEVIEHPQGIPHLVNNFNSFMEALRQGWLKHTGDPELRRHVLNAIARMLPRGDAIFERPSTSRKGVDQDRRVIDALDAAAMVHWVAAQNAARVEKKPPRIISLV